MDILNQLMAGFATAGTPINLLWALAGCALGTGIGVLPGLGGANGVAILLPLLKSFTSSRRTTKRSS